MAGMGNCDGNKGGLLTGMYCSANRITDSNSNKIKAVCGV